jgi:hypothetical protein
MTAHRGRRRLPGDDSWQDVGEDDHFAGDAYFLRWDDELSPGSRGLLPRRRDVLSPSVRARTPLWWRIWRWWR